MRGVVADALGQIGAAAKDAIPHLVDLLNDPSEGVRRAAADALEKVKSAANDTV